MFGYCNYQTFYPLNSAKDINKKGQLPLSKFGNSILFEGTKFGSRKLRLKDQRVQMGIVLILYSVAISLHGCG